VDDRRDARAAPERLVILWVVAATNVVLVLASPHGTGEGRYLLPLHAVLPCRIGEMSFPPTAVRYLRLRPAASAPRWDIEEVAVYE